MRRRAATTWRRISTLNTLNTHNARDGRQQGDIN